MVVVSRQNRRGVQGGYHPHSRTMVFSANQARVVAAQGEAGNWVQVTRLRGLGALNAIPTWAYWLGGGLLVGGVAGWFLLKRKK